MKVEQLDLNNKESNQPVDYYYYTLYIPTGEILCIKNGGCTAKVEDYLNEKYNLNHWDAYKFVKIFFMGTSSKINLDKIYKKYHKYFKDIEVSP